MNICHGFFIPDKEYLVNCKGLLNYLGRKITKGLLCIYCNNKGTKGFKNKQAVQKHMLDKQHCFMNIDEDDEYVKYYDYSEEVNKIIVA